MLLDVPLSISGFGQISEKDCKFDDPRRLNFDHCSNSNKFMARGSSIKSCKNLSNFVGIFHFFAVISFSIFPHTNVVLSSLIKFSCQILKIKSPHCRIFCIKLLS